MQMGKFRGFSQLLLMVKKDMSWRFIDKKTLSGVFLFFYPNLSIKSSRKYNLNCDKLV